VLFLDFHTAQIQGFCQSWNTVVVESGAGESLSGRHPDTAAKVRGEGEKGDWSVGGLHPGTERKGGSSFNQGRREVK